MAVDDFDGDGNLDGVMNGNDYGTEVTASGSYDALNGLMMKGDGKEAALRREAYCKAAFIYPATARRW